MIDKLKTKYKNINFTYGYKTKNHRIINSIEKSHSNDAFAIAKDVTQKRSNHIFEVKQSKRNNRSLEKFYDAKYIDIRTGDKVSSGYLNSGRTTRNRNLNTENLHQ